MVFQQQLDNKKFHEASPETPVKVLEVKKAFETLSDQEAKYAHYFSKASWLGAQICFEQVSFESPKIFELIMKLFSNLEAEGYHKEKIDKLKEIATQQVGELKYKQFIAYISIFLGNMGNYLSFGDSKIIPQISQEDFGTILSIAPVSSQIRSELESLYKEIADDIFSLTKTNQELGFPPHGITSYYSPGFTKEEAQDVSNFMQEKKIGVENSRVFYNKIKDSDQTIYQVKLASVDIQNDTPYEYNGSQGKMNIVVSSGDYSKILQKVVDNLKEAQRHAANDVQSKMLLSYVNFFQTGKLEEYINSQMSWVNDKNPAVETNIGFIETYRDPLNIRGEFEGLVSIVNKEMSQRFAQLVAEAEELLTLMPWPKDFEKDTFLKPDFTSLEVLSFAGTGVPAGINLPNFDSIRQTYGFKNVSLGNVLSAPESKDKITFIQEADQELFRTLKGPAFEVQVGGHELLGHGSGKLLSEEADGKLNFDPEKVINPLTGQKVTSWYKPGQTWNGQFGSLSSSYEECRAELSGLLMSVQEPVQKIFGLEGAYAQDVVYVNWLLMVRAGVASLEFYTPESKQWRQAHMRARYGILKTLIKASEDSKKSFVKVEELKGEDGPDLLVTLNREELYNIGVPAVKDLLLKIQIYKSINAVEEGSKFYNDLTAVDEKWTQWRNIVLARKKPRGVFTQAHTYIDQKTSKVLVQEFEGTHEGMVESFITRYTDV